MQVDIRELQERVERESSFVDALTLGMNQIIVGQKHLVESLLIGLLSDGHILLEGVPGLAKTLAIKTLSDLIKANFSRIQFTPDLLPADVIGTQIYSQKSEEFKIKKGPIFANFVLADEINRAPAKVQSALLEAMQERQVTIGEQTFKLDDPFLVLATQNPIEQEGTYPMPDAGSADRPFHAEGSDRLSEERGGAGYHPSEHRQREKDRAADSFDRRYHQGAQDRGGGLSGREDREIYRRYRVCDPRSGSVRTERPETDDCFRRQSSCKYQPRESRSRVRVYS